MPDAAICCLLRAPQTMAESFVGDARTHATLTLELRLRVSITISPQRFPSVSLTT